MHQVFVQSVRQYNDFNFLVSKKRDHWYCSFSVLDDVAFAFSDVTFYQVSLKDILQEECHWPSKISLQKSWLTLRDRNHNCNRVHNLSWLFCWCKTHFSVDVKLIPVTMLYCRVADISHDFPVQYDHNMNTHRSNKMNMYGTFPSCLSLSTSWYSSLQQ